jgi:hypothetical protein
MDDSVQKIIDAAEKKAKEDSDRLALIQSLTEKFPDLKVATNRWGRQRYSSALVNPIADKVHFGHNCGCCNDSPLEARPYIEVLGTEVFSSPDCFMVGERDISQSYYDNAYSGWEDELEKAGISQKAVDRVSRYLEAHEPPTLPEWDED